MSGRPKIFEEVEVIDRAIEVFWIKGYEASSAEDLLKAMNIGKGSFYLAFKGGKKELYEKSLEQFYKKASDKFEKDLENAKDQVEFLKQFFYSLADSSQEKKLKGCYLGNALVEMAGIDIDLKAKASYLLSKLEDSFRTIILQGQKNGSIKSKESPAIIAKHLINLWNGINITLRIHPKDKTIKEVIRLNLQILD